MKNIIIFITILVMLPLVSAIDECKGTMNDNEIPCTILLPVVPPKDCSTISVSFYRNGSNILHSINMDTYTLFACNTTFNYTGEGTYVFNYSTDDSGSIIIEEDVDNRYYLYVISMLVFFGLLWLGYYTEREFFPVMAGMLACVIGIHLYFNGFPNLTNEFLKQGMVAIIVGVGLYCVIAPSLEYFEREF